jgi:hypothetical protein
MQHGVVTAATVADHIRPHKGELNSFYFGPLQSLCAQCHNKDKKLIETHGHAHGVGIDGWPLEKKI